MKATGWVLFLLGVILAAYVAVALFMQHRVAEILDSRRRD